MHTLLGLPGLWALVSATGIDPFPVPYSSSFLEPVPPQVQSEFSANYMQQKYDDTGINHIVAGFVYFSPSQKKVRADGADGTLFTSLFDFTNVSAQGAVSNRQLSFIGGVQESNTTCFSEFIFGPAFPLFTPDMLNTSQAVFVGLQQDSLYGPLNAWQFLFPSAPSQSIPVTVYLDGNDTLVRYDFSAPGARTFATTRLFNIVEGPIDPVVFETDCK